MPYPTELRLRAVNAYLTQKGYKTLKEVADSFNISYRTLQRWLMWYRNGGKGNLKRRKTYRMHKNWLDDRVEKKIALLKEKKPWITLSETQGVLKKCRIKVSITVIWNIWKRYGLAGFIKDRASSAFIEYITHSKEAKIRVKFAKKAYYDGKMKYAAQILNSLPSCPQTPLLEKIPNRFLSLQRKLEKLYFLFEKTPFRELKKKARRLREQAEDKGLLYLAVRAGIIEVLTLDWLQEPENLLTLIHRLKNHLGEKRKKKFTGDSIARFTLFFLEGKAYADCLRIKDALRCAMKCRIILGSFLSSVNARRGLAALFVAIGYFREAGKLYNHAKSKQDPAVQLRIANILAITGAYRSALSTSRSIEPKLRRYYRYKVLVVHALCYLGQGEIGKTARKLQLFVQRAEKKAIRYDFHTGTLLLAACYAANRKIKEAKRLLKRHVPVLKKFGIKRDLFMRYIILGQTKHLNIDEENLTPPLRLALFLRKAQESLRIKDYRKAYRYAMSKGIVSHLHVLLLFFPEPVRKLLSQGKPTGLPTGLLKLPVFQYNIPVYHLKLLGPVRVYRNDSLIRDHLSPKETAFLIYLCLKKDKAIPLTSLFRNFWHTSRNPERTFSHFLVRIRKYLKLSLRSLYISKESFDKEKSLHFKAHVTTDYQYYEETLAQAKALERAGEWGFAKREYLRAFSLFRGEPFKKMYDDWSDDKRLETLFSYETEVISFAKKLNSKGRTEEAEKLLKRAERIVPDLR